MSGRAAAVWFVLPSRGGAVDPAVGLVRRRLDHRRRRAGAGAGAGGAGRFGGGGRRGLSRLLADAQLAAVASLRRQAGQGHFSAILLQWPCRSAGQSAPPQRRSTRVVADYSRQPTNDRSAALQTRARSIFAARFGFFGLCNSPNAPSVGGVHRAIVGWPRGWAQDGTDVLLAPQLNRL